MRSRNSVKPNIPFGKDSVDKLEGLGARTKMNLSDVRACVGHIDARAVVTVPKNAPNKIATGWRRSLVMMAFLATVSYLISGCTKRVEQFQMHFMSCAPRIQLSCPPKS